jgi:CYTH domain-containing protein
MTHPAPTSSPTDSGSPDSAPRTQPEIERKYLLRAMPIMPADVIVQRLEQGYLPMPASMGAATTDELTGGRIRRITHADVRMETEREITAEQFATAWARTRNRRLTKTRHLRREGPFVWAVDRFDHMDLVLAEVEMPSADAMAPIPPWLEGYVVREVTDDPRYGNYTLALAIGAKD